MSKDVDLKLVGDKEILAAFRALDAKTQHRQLHKVLNHAANIPKKAQRQAIPVRKTKLKPTGEKWHPPGTGRKSTIKKRGRSRKNAVLFVGPKTRTGSYKTDAFYLKFWDLYNPGKRILTRATERTLKPTEKQIFNSMRVVLQRAWNKHRR